MSRHTPFVVSPGGGLAGRLRGMSSAAALLSEAWWTAILSHYKGVATEIEYPDVEAQRLADVEGAKRPLSLMNNDPQEIWNLTLEEAVQMALNNNKVIREYWRAGSGPARIHLEQS